MCEQAERASRLGRIAFYIDTLSVGGAETIAVNYLIVLRRRGYDVCLIELYETDSFLTAQLRAADVPVFNLFHVGGSRFSGLLFKVKKRLFAGQRVRRTVRREKVSLFHSHAYWSYFSDVGLPRRRMFYSLHTAVGRNREIYGARHRVNLEALLDGGMHLLTLCEAMRKDALRFYPQADVRVLFNGFDLDKIRRGGYDKKQFLTELGYDPNRFVLGHVGRFYPVKNHEKIFEIFDAVRARRPDALLMLVGTGNAEERARIDGLIRQHAVADSVILLGLRSDAAAIVHVFDAMLLPSHNEGFPLVMIEAQAQNVRTVVTAAVSTEMVCNRNCFRLPVSESAETWAELLLADTLRETETPLEVYDIDRVLDRLTEIYEETAAKEDGK